MSEKVVISREGATLVITLNRPEVRNAIDLETASAIAAGIDLLESDDELTVGVLTGAGGVFSAGMDLAAFRRGERPYVPGRGFGGIAESAPAKPLVSAVEGYALGGGFEIALVADIIVASAGARFGLPEVRRGLIASGGGILRLRERVPPSIAAEWILTGRFVTAEEAARHGLVNLVAPDGESLARALELAGTIAGNGPLAVRASKRVLVESSGWAAADRFDRQAEIADAVRASADSKEGAAAFVEKRPPRWTGR